MRSRRMQDDRTDTDPQLQAKAETMRTETLKVAPDEAEPVRDLWPQLRATWQGAAGPVGQRVRRRDMAKGQKTAAGSGATGRTRHGYGTLPYLRGWICWPHPGRLLGHVPIGPRSVGGGAQSWGKTCGGGRGVGECALRRPPECCGSVSLPKIEPISVNDTRIVRDGGAAIGSLGLVYFPE